MKTPDSKPDPVPKTNFSSFSCSCVPLQFFSLDSREMEGDVKVVSVLYRLCWVENWFIRIFYEFILRGFVTRLM